MRRVAVVYVPVALALLVGLRIWQGDGYGVFSEGVYLFSARLITEGHVPYQDFIAAHPPLLFYSGAAVLAVSDSLDAIRFTLAAVHLLTGLGVAAIVWRLTGSAAGAVAGGVASLLTPWTLHEHATLMPETLGAPVLVAATLLAARERTVVPAAVVAAVAIGIKWPFILPGLLLALVLPARVRYLAWFGLSFAVGVGLSFVLFGGRLDDQLVDAQQEIGWHNLSELGGLLAQGAWNLAPLILVAATTLLARGAVRDQAQFRALLAVTGGALVLVLTVTKTGTYLNVIALAEPFLVALGATGVTLLVRDRRGLVLAVAAAAVAFTVIQSAAFVADPKDPGVFVRPFSDPAHGWQATDDQVDAAVRAAKGCPPGVAYSGQPFYAFLADRRMPGDEPDQFLLATDVGARHLADANAESSRCP